MSDLFSARSLKLCLQREDFAKALKDLKKLARDRPDEFGDPAGVIAAEQLDGALRAAFWKPTFDAHGDLTALEYFADKLPRNALDANAFLSTLAKAGARGSFLVFPEGRRHQWLWLRHGNLLDSNRLLSIETIGGDILARPGSTVVGRFRMNPGGEPPPERIALHAVSANGDWNPSPSLPSGGVKKVELDGSEMSPGEERKVAIRLGPDARGQIDVCFAREPKGCASPYEFSFQIEIPPEKSDWKILSSRSSSSRRMLTAGDAKRALIQAQRFAERNAEKPGGKFLLPVVHAKSVGEVLRAAGLDGDLEAESSEVRVATKKLPGAEPLFWGLLDALSAYGAEKHRCSPSFSVRYSHAPDLQYEYTLGRRATRRIASIDG